MQLKFYLNKQKVSKHGDRPVYMSVTFENKRIRKPVTGVHCSEKFWDEKNQRIKRSSNKDPFNETASFNNRLDFIDSQMKLIKQSAFDRRVRLTEKFILDRLNDESNLIADRHDFFTIVNQYLESIRSVKANRTILGKVSAFNFLGDFQREEKYEITFENINLEFFEALRNYAFESRKIEDNYFAKIVAVTKTFLNWAHERDHIKDQTFRKFRALERPTEVICLTLEEFNALYAKDFNSRRLNQVRDVFIFGCSTGLRFSDLISLKESHITEDFITKNIQKTQETIMIPLNKFSRAILAKYEDTVQYPLPKVSSQKFNQYIKECCQIVGIDTPISITRFSGGVRKEATYPKYELISSHAARKTFTTLSLILGVPERIVRNITGHKKEENFRKYVNFSKEFEKQQLDTVWNSM